MSGFVRHAMRDTASPHVGTALGDYQALLYSTPILRQSDFLVVYIHGSKGNAGNPWVLTDNNTPGAMTALVSHSTTGNEQFASMSAFCSHDFASIVSGALKVDTFGGLSVNNIIEGLRKNLAPALGCRSDRIVIMGGSQGAGDAMQYTFQYPEHTAACLLEMPGNADLDYLRIDGSPNRDNINQAWGNQGDNAWTLIRNKDLGGGVWDRSPLKLGGDYFDLNNTSAPGSTVVWKTGNTYHTNDFIYPDTNSLIPREHPELKLPAQRCLQDHTATGTTMPYNDGVYWETLNPEEIHYLTYPPDLLTGLPGGTSLKFQPGAPADLVGRPANLLEPDNLNRFQQIIAGTWPACNGRAVPVVWPFSRGDIIAMGSGPSNGVAGYGTEWLCDRVGAEKIVISDVYNHSSDQGRIQQMDHRYAVTQTLSAVGDTIEVQLGANQMSIFELSAMPAGYSVTFQVTNVADGSSGWADWHANSTPWRLADIPRTEGATVTTTSVAKRYRVDTTGGPSHAGLNPWSGYYWARVIVAAAPGVQTPWVAIAGVTYATDMQQTALPLDIFMDRIREANEEWTVVDYPITNPGDGFYMVAGKDVVDNEDGTFTMNNPAVVDNGDGTFTLTTNQVA